MSNYGHITLTTSPQLIVSANNNRRGLILDNQDVSVDAYIGPDTSISSSNAVRLQADVSLVFDDRFIRTAIYGVTATGTCVVAWWETAQ